MAQLNTRTTTPPPVTHGGAHAARISPLMELRRSVMATLLWEDTFYEEGVSIAERIEKLVPMIPADDVSKLAIEARTQMNLRHAPLLLAVLMAKHFKGKIVSQTIEKVVQRADELAEFMALYWRKGKTPISKQVRLGLKAAFAKFDAYQLAKYNREKNVTLRDVMFLVHAKPSEKQLGIGPAVVGPALVKGKYKRGEVARHPHSLLAKLTENTLAAPDTWEVSLSGGANKKETFERLLREGKLGYLALLRNLRNMSEAGVSEALVGGAILARKGGADRVLPFRFLAAARAAPRFERQLDEAMLANANTGLRLPGSTVVVVDCSGSMWGTNVSAKSDLSRLDAAGAVAAVASAMGDNVRVFATAGDDMRRVHATCEVPPRRGIALVDTFKQQRDKIGGGGIFLNQCCKYLREQGVTCDRMIVITDEQDCSSGGADAPSNAEPLGTKANYLINVASYKNGIGYGRWTHIDGFSESVLRYIAEAERMSLQ